MKFANITIAECENTSTTSTPAPPTTTSTTTEGPSPTTTTEAPPCGDVPFPTFDPPNGSEVLLPTFVALATAEPGGAVHYTLDGSTPDKDSPVYTGPFLVESADTVIKAVSVSSDCRCESLVAQAQYVAAAEVEEFERVCDAQDWVGGFGLFIPDGIDDLHWRFIFETGAPKEILRIEMYLLDAMGVWSTGQAWSTANPIYPFDAAPTVPFNVYPLAVVQGGVQLFASYQNSLGDFNGANVFDLFGKELDTPSGFFKIKVYLEEGEIWEVIIAADCPEELPVTVPSKIHLVARCEIPCESGNCEFSEFRIYVNGDLAEPARSMQAQQTGESIDYESTGEYLPSEVTSIEVDIFDCNGDPQTITIPGDGGTVYEIEYDGA